MKLDWKWIGMGLLIMFGLSILASLILAMVLAPSLKGVTDPADIQLTTGQIGLAALLNFLAFVIGGYLVGVKSAGRTILEPAIAAGIAVAASLLMSGNFTLGNLVAGALVPFLAGLLGGWLGEKRQDAKTTPGS
jgi:O-antigen/teichoic acid export membrane protein